MKKIKIYLISDSTGETVSSVSRSAIAHFSGVEVEEHLWSFVQTSGKLEKLKEELEKKPGIVMYTLVDSDLSKKLLKICKELEILCIPVLSRVISDLSSYLKIEAGSSSGKQHELTEEYFSRVDAVNFALSHDDGRSSWDLGEADIILVGPSRTSKSPTSLYLAYKGYRAANVPFIKGCELPKELFLAKNSLILGLTINPEILVQIRKNRVLSLAATENSRYVDIEEIVEEIKEAKKICLENNWPIVDVSRRSVEETSALVLQFYEKKKIIK